jgi:hypothetical protein
MRFGDGNRFRPALESLADRINPSTLVPTSDGADSQELIAIYTRSGSVAAHPADEGTTTLEGHECLVFYLGGLPSP